MKNNNQTLMNKVKIDHVLFLMILLINILNNIVKMHIIVQCLTIIKFIIPNYEQINNIGLEII